MSSNGTEQDLSRIAAAIVESSDVGIISKDLRGIITSWNPSAERIFGYTAAEAVGRPITMLFPADRYAEEEQILATIARGERVERYETVRITKDGRAIDVSLTISPVRDASGTIVGASKIVQDITERNRLEAARARLAAIVDSSDDAIVSKDLRGIIQSWNRGADRIFGYTAQEAIGQSVLVLIPPDRHSEEAAILAKIGRGERVEHYETVRRTKDGRMIEVSLTISPIFDASGKIIGVSKIARDITERRRIQRELAAQRERFRVTLASVGDGVIAASVEGRVTFLNVVAEKLTGWSPEEALGRPLTEVFRIVSEKTGEPVENPAQMVLRSGITMGLANHTALISRDGTERPIADSAAPIFDDDHQIIGVVLTFRDITDQRRAEEALQEQREWFEQTLQGIGDGVIATDIRGQVVFMNPVAEYLTGRRHGDCIGASCVDVFPILNEHTREPVENPIRRVLLEGKVVGLANHTVLIAADGTERCIDDSAAPILSRSGRVVGAVLVFRDVTERRRNELERAASARERERLLESERAARSAAERANRLKDEFVATLSHELRTPLNAILGWAQILRTQASSRPDLLERGIEVIERNTRIQSQIVSDLLDVSRIMSGKLTLDMRNADIAGIVESAVESTLPSAQAKSVDLHKLLDRSIGSVAGDPARLQQIVWNLLSNAIKFTPPGGRVDVILGRRDGEACIIVRDTGIGIHRDFLPALFERFRQADAATNRRYGGLGLGLAIVKQLVELHGGSVQASSEGEGCGSEFIVRLPIASARPLVAEAEDAPATPQEPSPQADLRGMHVLVVDDDEDTSEVLQRFLENAGARAMVVHSATAALDAIPRHLPQILISDISMPGIDGYELIRRVRQLDAARGGAIPAVAVTAFARAEDRTRALLAGYQAHLAKPIEATELIATVRMLSSLTVTYAAASDPD